MLGGFDTNQMRYGKQMMDGCPVDPSSVSTAFLPPLPPPTMPLPSPGAPTTASTPLKSGPSPAASSSSSAPPTPAAAAAPGLSFDDDEHRSQALSRLNTMRKEGHLCDAVLEVGSHSISVHRAVLACCSTYMFERFSRAVGTGGGGRDEEALSRGLGKLQHLKLEGLDPASVEILVNYAYTARLECEADQVKSVYRTASVLKMQRAAEACSRYLADNLTPQNCLSTRAFATNCSDQELAGRTNTFIQDHIQAILERSPELFRFPAIVVDIIGVEPNNLSSDGERPLCKLVVDWLETAAEDSHVENLVENPHVLYLTSDNNLRDCLEELDDDEISNTDIVRDYKKLGKRKMMTPLRGNKDKLAGSARQSHSSSTTSFGNGNSSSSESLLSVGGETSLVATVRMGDKSFMCIAVLNDRLTRVSIKFRPQQSGVTLLTTNGTSTVDGSRSPAHEDRNGARSPAVDKQCLLTPLAKMSSARCGLGTAVLNGHLVALGGYDRGECLNTVESFSLVANAWTPLKPMLTARGRFAAAEMDGKLYACGGSNGQVDLRSVECYDPETMTWMALPDMSIQRSSSGVAASGGKLFVIGGWSGCSGRAICEIYNPDTKAWQPIANLNMGRSQVAVCALDGGRVVAVGGCDAWNCTNTVEVYDPATNRWTYLPPMAVARRGAGVAFFKNKLYVVGGSDGQTSLVSVEIFDFAAGAWSSGPSIGTPRANMGVALVRHRLFVVGGFSGKAFLDSMEYLSEDGEEWCAYQPSTESVEPTPVSSFSAPMSFTESCVNGNAVFTCQPHFTSGPSGDSLHEESSVNEDIPSLLFENGSEIEH